MNEEKAMNEFFGSRLRDNLPSIGYWVTSDNPVATERIGHAGYDYVCIDLQHGMIDYGGAIRNLTALAATGTSGVVRVPVNEPSWIGRALDAGAEAVIVPLVDTAAEAAAAARACRYPPAGVRSFGPMRSSLRIGPEPRVADQAVACIAMIETRAGLDAAAEIAAVDGVDALYVGPSDLALALGFDRPAEGPSHDLFQRALDDVLAAAAAGGIPAGLHCNDGIAGRAALDRGFGFVSISNDLNHLAKWVRAELKDARGGDAV
jgi:4-hydroxy-2-oxoheptanedioate aldolase